MSPAVLLSFRNPARRYKRYLVFPIYSFWIPQILYCVYHEARQPLRPLYVVGMTLTRLALPLYVFGCPHNVLKLQSDPGICIGLCLSMAIQVRHVSRAQKYLIASIPAFQSHLPLALLRLFRL